MSISQARKNIFDIAERVQTPGTAFTLTDNGKPKVVMMSAEEFESWAETLEVIKDFPDLKKDIAEAERDFKKGNYITLDEFMKNDQAKVAKKDKRRAVSGRHSKTGPKAA